MRPVVDPASFSIVTLVNAIARKMCPGVKIHTVPKLAVNPDLLRCQNVGEPHLSIGIAIETMTMMMTMI